MPASPEVKKPAASPKKPAASSAKPGRKVVTVKLEVDSETGVVSVAISGLQPHPKVEEAPKSPVPSGPRWADIMDGVESFPVEAPPQDVKAVPKEETVAKEETLGSSEQLSEQLLPQLPDELLEDAPKASS